MEMLRSNTFFYVFLTLVTYEVGLMLKKRFKLSIFNPLLISTIISIAVLVIFDFKVEDYKNGTKFISFLLTPSTVCLAIPLYEKLNILKAHALSVILGIFSGVLTSLSLVLVFSILLGLNHQELVSLLPKSITTPIGIALCNEYGGLSSITVAVIVITGIIGAVASPLILKVFKITNPIAKGIAIGTSSHALGTSKALEMGEIEGAMSGLSIAVAGLFTVVLFSFFVL